MVRFTSTLLSLLATGALATPIRPRDGPKYFFVFGDSYSSTGFDISGAKPSTANPMGNPALPGDTLAGGLTWAGHATLTYNTSLVLTYDFAVSGATVNASLISAYDPSIPDMTNQISIWVNNLSPAPSYAPWTAENSLFAVYIGTNDVGNSYATGTDVLVSDQQTLLQQLQILYSHGARKFLVLNVPPTNKTPLILSYAAADQAELQTSIAFWNSHLDSLVSTFLAGAPGATVTRANTTTAWNTAINNPTAYGATDSTCISCAGSPIATCDSAHTCLWYNSYHPDQAIQKLIAQAAVAAVPDFF